MTIQDLLKKNGNEDYVKARGKSWQELFHTWIEVEGVKMAGYLLGDDECFDFNDLYHYFITEDMQTLYKAYFEYNAYDEDSDTYDDFAMDKVDWHRPYKLQNITAAEDWDAGK